MRKARKGMSEMLEEPYVPANLAGGRKPGEVDLISRTYRLHKRRYLLVTTTIVYCIVLL